MIAISAIHGGGDAFDGLLYPPQHSNTTNYIRGEIQKLQQLASNGSAYLTNLYNSAFAKWQEFTHGESAMIGEAARRAMASVTGDVFVIYPATTLALMQQSSVVMQRWIMANEEIRHLHHQNACSAFDGNYIDHHPGNIGFSHYDYRRVMDGVVIDDGEDSYSYTISEDIVDGDRNLTLREQTDILDTWEAMRAYIEAGYDPTSPTNAKL